MTDLIAKAKRVAFQGELGAFGNQAAREALPHCEAIPKPSFEDAVDAVRSAWGVNDETPVPLELRQGAVLHLAAGTYMKVATLVDGGTLEATGTAAEPVVFTSIADDSVGGDTNDGVIPLVVCEPSG